MDIPILSIEPFTLCILDVYYVAFGVKNSYEKDIYLETNMREPYKKISIPEGAQIQRTIVLLHQNLVNIRAFDAATKQSIKIDNQDYITLTPSEEKPNTLRVYHVPKEGKSSAMIPFHVCFFYIYNMRISLMSRQCR